MSKKIIIASDHGGFAMKTMLIPFLRETLGCAVDDFGPFDEGSVDYPDFAIMVAKGVASGEYDFGIMIDGVGIGSTMVANKVKGVRCALCYDDFTANNAREHNHANMLCIGGQTLGHALAKAVVKKFLTTEAASGRHADRVKKIMAVELLS
jgi:ribose 5-phosphate isomerase B